jgi:ATP-dependent Lon protease
VIVSVNQIEASHRRWRIRLHRILSLKIEQKQELLELASTHRIRLEKIYGFMEGEIGVLQVEKRIRNRVKRQMEKTQREYYLNEQMKAIQKELGEGEDGLDEIGELEKKIDEAKLSKEAREKARLHEAEETAPDVADVGGGDSRAQLPRLDSRVPWGKKTR